MEEVLSSSFHCVRTALSRQERDTQLAHMAMDSSRGTRTHTPLLLGPTIQKSRYSI